MTAHQYEPAFALRHAAKDVGLLALAAAERDGVALPLLRADRHALGSGDRREPWG